jgi:hypothetical protein
MAWPNAEQRSTEADVAGSISPADFSVNSESTFEYGVEWRVRVVKPGGFALQLHERRTNYADRNPEEFT